jgi:outer membrane lipoprotein-sorting protein
MNSFLCGMTAREIVEKSDQLLRANSSISEISMTIIKPDWSREIRMKVWAIEPDYALILITEPARDEGTVTLKRKTEVWNYIPRVDRVIKVPPSMMMQSWMGSDFTNDDLVRESSIVEDYTHSLLGEDSLRGYDCYKIEMLPKPEAGVVWDKIIVWITKDGFMQLRADYYDEDGNMVRSMIGSEIQEMGGRVIPTHWEMIPHDEEDQKTILDYHSIKFNVDLDPSFFSRQNMKRIR